MIEKIGIMGGSFDPIHNGHLIIAERAREQFNLDRIIFVPTGNPPHKENVYMSSAKDRFAMTSFAIEDNEYFSISDIESRDEKITYTINTLKYFKEVYKKSSIYFILGGDSLRDLDTWKDYREILKDFKIIVAKRERDDEELFLESFKRLDFKFPNTIYILDSPLVEISSTYIRDMSRKKKSIKYLVTKKVEDYILNKRLYY